MSDLKRIADTLEKLLEAVTQDSIYINIAIKADSVVIEGIEFPAELMPSSVRPIPVTIV